MIEFNYETDFQLTDESQFEKWIQDILVFHQKVLGSISFIFCNDDYLHKINVAYLNHDTLTDVIGFDYSEGNTVSGDVFISIERVTDNANDFKQDFHVELLRVMSHGVLHFIGFKDKSDFDESIMRLQEDHAISLFHVKQ